MIPQLRFPEFTDEWQVKKLGDLFSRVTRKNKENNQNILTISARHGLVGQEKFFSKIVAAKDVSGYYLLHKNDYAYNKSYSKGYPMGAIKRLNESDKGVVSTLYICFNANDDNLVEFYDQYFEAGRLNNEIEKIAQEGARNHGLLNMAVGDFFATELLVPESKPEQEKIAEFLTAVDERIAAGEKKLELLQKYKKGVMQKIFTKAIRFKDENGNPYSEWEEKRLGEYILDSKLSSTTQDEYPVLTSSRQGLVLQKDYYGDDNRITNRTNVGYNVVKPNEITYRSRSDDGIFRFNLNTTSVTGVVSYFYPVFSIVKGSEKFFEEFLNYNWRVLYKYSVGTSQKVLAHAELKKIIFSTPTMEEQQKITTFLTALDAKIAAEQTRLTAAKQWKKGLLQRMFV